MLEVLLHAIVDELRSDKVHFFKTRTSTMKEKRWWKMASMWIKVARMWLPLTYLIIAMALIMSGVFNVILGNQNDEV